MTIHKSLAFHSAFSCGVLIAMLMAGCQSKVKNGPAPSVAPTVNSTQSNAAANLPWPNVQEVRAHMKAAFRPELKGVIGAVRKKPAMASSWQHAVFYMGVSAVWQATGDNEYLNALMQWGNHLNWQPGSRERNADDLACGQAFIEIFQRKGGPERIAAVRARVDAFLASPRPGHEDWSWCDSFFMAPPVFVKLSAATGDAHYREAMHPLYWDAVEPLWDEQNGLFYRDDRFVGKSPMVFWARGNSWVLAGLARVLEGLPADDSARPRYESLFKTLAASIVKLQGGDGAWRADLLDSEKYPLPESSSTALFGYGLAWGVNHGLLANADFAPAVLKAWAALKRAQMSNGRLGGVQPQGDRPDDFKPTDFASFGCGAFLLFGAELLPHPLSPTG